MTYGGASKNFLGSLPLAIFYGPLMNYAVIGPLFNEHILLRIVWILSGSGQPRKPGTVRDVVEKLEKWCHVAGKWRHIEAQYLLSGKLTQW